MIGKFGIVALMFFAAGGYATACDLGYYNDNGVCRLCSNGYYCDDGETAKRCPMDKSNPESTIVAYMQNVEDRTDPAFFDMGSKSIEFCFS